MKLEAEYFRALNRAIEPVVRAGCGSPGFIPIGLIVLETKGWRTGRWHRTPQLASEVAGYLLVSTVRGRRSHWVKNLRRSDEVRYWRGGQLRQARAFLFAPEAEAPDLQEFPPLLSSLGPSLTCFARVLGCAYALLAPLPSPTA